MSIRLMFLLCVSLSCIRVTADEEIILRNADAKIAVSEFNRNTKAAIRAYHAQINKLDALFSKKISGLKQSAIETT